ncbi:MAG: plasmid stabilization system [Flavobacterium sp. BFFFF2]|nr:MAG: plasmid stabilization system [Flavobacterium sp. BFFFF2]
MEIEFALAIEKAIHQVLIMPFAYPKRYHNMRIAHPKIFPFNIHFYIDEHQKTIVFTAIIHNKRNSELAQKWIDSI